MKTIIKSWSLFWLLTLVTSAVILVGLPGTDFHSARGITPIILRAVRCALPLFLIAFSASSLTVLWPNALTRWLLANRRYFGLAFAFSMSWHFGFVAYTIWSFGNPLNGRDTALDLIGFTFLLLLTLTSFRWGARRVSRANWRRLHKVGVYAIWLLATDIYYHAVRGGTDRIHQVILAALLAAWLLRLGAWAKQRFVSRNRAAARTAALPQP